MLSNTSHIPIERLDTKEGAHSRVLFEIMTRTFEVITDFEERNQEIVFQSTGCSLLFSTSMNLIAIELFSISDVR